MVPLVVLLLVTAKRRVNFAVFTARKLFVFLALFVVAVVANISLSITSPQLVPFASLGLVIVSGAYSLWLYARAMRSQV